MSDKVSDLYVGATVIVHSGYPSKRRSVEKITGETKKYWRVGKRLYCKRWGRPRGAHAWDRETICPPRDGELDEIRTDALRKKMIDAIPDLPDEKIRRMHEIMREPDQ